MRKYNRTYLLHHCSRWLVCGLLLLLSQPAAASDIYMYIDSQGVMHFTNVPTSSDYKIYIKGRPQRKGNRMDADRFDRYIDEAAGLHGVDFP